MLTKTVQSETGKRVSLVYNFTDTEKVIVSYEHIMESFTLFEIDIHVDQLFDQYAQLNDDEINMNFDHTHIKSQDMLKQLPEEIKSLVSKGTEEINDYDEDANTIIYKHKTKLLPKSTIQEFIDSEISTVLDGIIENGEINTLSGELLERAAKKVEQTKNS